LAGEARSISGHSDFWGPEEPSIQTGTAWFTVRPTIHLAPFFDLVEQCERRLSPLGLGSDEKNYAFLIMRLDPSSQTIQKNVAYVARSDVNQILTIGHLPVFGAIGRQHLQGFQDTQTSFQNTTQPPPSGMIQTPH
jgi:hypothetical protein